MDTKQAKINLAKTWFPSLAKLFFLLFLSSPIVENMEAQTIQTKIYEVRGYKVMLDHDLAALYGIETKRLKESVKRNLKRFPPDFLIKLKKTEFQSLRSQIATSNRGGTRYLPYAFTEQGVAMLASILNSPKAIKVNIAIVRAFVLMRHLANSNKEIRERLKMLEQTYNKKFKDIDSALVYLMRKDAIETAHDKRQRIGFKTHEKKT